MIINTDSWPGELKGFTNSTVFFPHQPPFSRVLWWGWEINPRSFNNNKEEKYIYNAIHFHYIISGEISLTIDGKPSVLKPGDAFIITSPANYSYEQHGNVELQMIGFYVYGSDIASFAKKISSLCNSIIQIDSEHPALQYLLVLAKYTIQMQLTHQDVECEKCVIYVMNILMELYRVVKKNIESNTEYPEYNAFNYMMNNYQKSITIKDIADNILISPNYFISIFKNATGYSPMQYLTKIRLYLAIMSMQHTKKSLNDTAKIYGLTNSVKFCHLCKKHLSVTPTEAAQYSDDDIKKKLWTKQLPPHIYYKIKQYSKVLIGLPD